VALALTMDDSGAYHRRFYVRGRSRRAKYVSYPLADAVRVSRAADCGCHGGEVLRRVASGLRHVPGWSGRPKGVE